MNLLNGQKLTHFSISRSPFRCRFSFDLGARLVTYPIDKAGELWFLYTPHNKVLTVRADRKYSYGSSNPQNEQWKPLFAP